MTSLFLSKSPLYPEKQSVSGKIWYLRSSDDRISQSLSQRLKLSLTASQIIASRGLTLETAPSFLSPTLRDLMPDPSHLLDCDKAVERILQALTSRQKICVFGDYDVDGATSSALLRRYFRDIGVEISLYIPDRIDEGYGPNCEALRLLKKQGIDLVLMVDCGTTSFTPLTTAQDCGLDVIVIDHHTAQPALPPAVAIVNPNRLDESSPLTTLCAAGMCFMVVVALHRGLRQSDWFKDGKAEPDLRLYLDLVALGTVCDVMPLIGLNRAFVAQGLKIMRHRSNLGLTTLADVASIAETPSAYHLGFVLGPRINAGGRVGKSDLGSRLLYTLDPIEARTIAEELNALNLERQVIEATVTEEAFSEIDRHELHKNPVIIVKGDKWHPGVIGIVASRLKERYFRPVCVVSFDENNVGKGSGRSISGVHLGSAMHAAQQKGLLVHGGGHAMAAGFTVMADTYAEFTTFIQDRLASQVASTEPSLDIDGVLSPSGATENIVTQISQLEPFGTGNPTPKFSLQYIKIGYAERIGSNHIRCQLIGQDGTRLKGMAFRAAETPLGDVLLTEKDQLFHVAVTLKIDTWNGRRTITCFIDDLMLA